MKKFLILCMLFLCSLASYGQINITANTNATYVRFALSVDNVLQNGSNGTVNTVTAWQTSKVITFADLDAVQAYAQSFGIAFDVPRKICFRIQGKKSNCVGANCIGNWSANARCFNFAADAGLTCEDCVEIALANVTTRLDSVFFDVCEVDESGACITVLNTYGILIPIADPDTVLLDSGVYVHVNTAGNPQFFGYTYASPEGSIITNVVPGALPGTYEVQQEVDFCAQNYKENGLIFGGVDGCGEQDTVFTFTDEGAWHETGVKTQYANRDLWVTQVNALQNNWNFTKLIGPDIVMSQYESTMNPEKANLLVFSKAYGTALVPADVIVTTGAGQLLFGISSKRLFGGLETEVVFNEVRSYGNASAYDSTYWTIASPLISGRAAHYVGYGDAIFSVNVDNGDLWAYNYPGDTRRDVNTTGSYLFTDATGRLQVGAFQDVVVGLEVTAECSPNGGTLFGLNNGSTQIEVPADSLYIDGVDLILAHGECSADTVKLTPAVTVVDNGNQTNTINDGTNTFCFESCCATEPHVNTIIEYCDGVDGVMPPNGMLLLANGGINYKLTLGAAVIFDLAVPILQYNTPLDFGIYFLEIESIAGCIDTFPITVRRDCPPTISGDATGTYTYNPATQEYDLALEIPVPCEEFYVEEVISVCPGTPVPFPVRTNGLFAGTWEWRAPNGSLITNWVAPGDDCGQYTLDNNGVPFVIDPGNLGVAPFDFGVYSIVFVPDTGAACPAYAVQCRTTFAFHVIEDAGCGTGASMVVNADCATIDIDGVVADVQLCDDCPNSPPCPDVDITPFIVTNDDAPRVIDSLKVALGCGPGTKFLSTL